MTEISIESGISPTGFRDLLSWRNEPMFSDCQAQSAGLAADQGLDSLEDLIRWHAEFWILFTETRKQVVKGARILGIVN